jgi:hypothetical protein
MASENKVQAGVCRFCGCTEAQACVFEFKGQPHACWWVDADRTVCSSPPCWKRLYEELRASRNRPGLAA